LSNAADVTAFLPPRGVLPTQNVRWVQHHSFSISGTAFRKSAFPIHVMGRPRPVLGVDPEVIIQIGDDFKKFPWVDATAGVFEGSAPKPTPPSDHIPLGRRCADHLPVLMPRATGLRLELNW
jgi:hypothetical protein